jgi:hypothetical protein
MMIDQQVPGDRQQPRALRGAARVEPAPRPQRALERRLREVLGGVAVAQPVGQEAVDAPQVLVVDAREIGLSAVQNGLPA